jgi:hypothetical protein
MQEWRGFEAGFVAILPVVALFVRYLYFDERNEEIW